MTQLAGPGQEFLQSAVGAVVSGGGPKGRPRSVGRPRISKVLSRGDVGGLSTERHFPQRSVGLRRSFGELRSKPRGQENRLVAVGIMPTRTEATSEEVAVGALCRPAFYAELVARPNSKARRLAGIIAHRGDKCQ